MKAINELKERMLALELRVSQELYDRGCPNTTLCMICEHGIRVNSKGYDIVYCKKKLPNDCGEFNLAKQFQ